jgi:DNA-binding PadR family transcriptional regulator
MLCVLNKLIVPTYGYNLVEILSNSGIPVEANTLYPMLRRMENQGLVESAWNTESAKPRKYYCITEMGRQVLDLLKQHWNNIVKTMNIFFED